MKRFIEEVAIEQALILNTHNNLLNPNVDGDVRIYFQAKYTQLEDFNLTLKLRDHTRLAIKDIEGLHAEVPPDNQVEL
jgi:hypothetical protein